MNKVTSQAALPVAANSTGGQASARATSPAGHFSHSEIPAQGGGGLTGDGKQAGWAALHSVRSVLAKVHHKIFAWWAGTTSAESVEVGLVRPQLVEGQHPNSDAVDPHGTARADGGAHPHSLAVAHIEDDGFVTVHPPMGQPRNHAEEIANALASAEHRKRVEGEARINFELECG